MAELLTDPLMKSDNDRRPFERVKGNQATYLFFPIFISLVLTLIGTLSASLIPGLSVVEIYSANGTGTYGENRGVVKLGGWGMCIEGFENYTSTCVPYTIFGNNSRALARLPKGVLSLGIDPSLTNDTYKIVNAVFHALASGAGIICIIVARNAMGEYQAKGKYAWAMTKTAWHGNTIMFLLTCIPFGLDIAFLAKAKAAMQEAGGGSAGKAFPGATIYMSAAALAINLTTFFVWLFWAQRQPPPSWIYSDYVVEPSAREETEYDWDHTEKKIDFTAQS